MKRFPIAALFCFAAVATIVTSPARAQRLAAPTPIPLTKTSAKQAEPLTGFQDIKWGDSITKATKAMEAKGASVEKITGSDYSLRVSNLKVAGYETRDVTLRFGSEGFYKASVNFFSPPTAETTNPYYEIRLIIAERFGEPEQERSGGGFGGLGGNAPVSQWRFGPSNKEASTLTLTTNPSAQAHLEYRATDRAEREEGRIRAEKAKSL